MVASRRSASPHGSARGGGVLILTQPPSTVFQTQVAGDGTQDSSTMLHLKVQLGPGEYASVRGHKSADIKRRGLIVAELYRFDYTRVPVFCPDRQAMVGLRVPQTVFEFDVDRSRPDMTLKCRRKHLPVSKNYGGAPFRFVLYFQATGAAVSTEPFMIASKQPQPKQEPKRKRKRSEFLPYPEVDSARDERIKQALGVGAADSESGMQAASGGGGGGGGGEESSSSAGLGADCHGVGIVVARRGSAVGLATSAEGDGADRAAVSLPTAALPRDEPARPRKRRRVSVCPEASVMGGGEDGFRDDVASGPRGVVVPIGGQVAVREPAAVLAQFLVQSSSATMASSSGVGCMGVGFGLGLGSYSSRKLSASSAFDDAIEGSGQVGMAPGVDGEDEAVGSTASGSRSPSSAGEADVDDTLFGMDLSGMDDAASVASGGIPDALDAAAQSHLGHDMLPVTLPRAMLVPGASVGLSDAVGLARGASSSSGYPASSPMLPGRMVMQDSCASIAMIG